MSSRPGRADQSWTPEEETKLLSLLKEGKSTRIVAAELERTPYAIQCHIDGMVVDRFKKGVDPSDIAKTLNLEKDDVDLIMKDHVVI